VVKRTQRQLTPLRVFLIRVVVGGALVWLLSSSVLLRMRRVLLCRWVLLLRRRRAIGGTMDRVATSETSASHLPSTFDWIPRGRMQDRRPRRRLCSGHLVLVSSMSRWVPILRFSVPTMRRSGCHAGSAICLGPLTVLT
jgi:hypothetical protein